MAVQTYPVPCACGRVHEVSAGDAGRRFACACGTMVEVPSLVKLKASVGQSAVSPDLELDQIMHTSVHPFEDTCGVCGHHTALALRALVECEVQEERSGGSAIQEAASGCLIGLFGSLGRMFAIDAEPERFDRSVGRYVVYHLPIRVCSSCARGDWTKDSTRAVLERTPLYARLLAKYPHAKIGTPALTERVSGRHWACTSARHSPNPRSCDNTQCRSGARWEDSPPPMAAI